MGPGSGLIVPCMPLGDRHRISPRGEKCERLLEDACKMTSKATVVYDPKPRAYKAVRVWLSNGRRMLGMWTGSKWWSMEGEIQPVRWELEERRKKTDKLRKAIP